MFRRLNRAAVKMPVVRQVVPGPHVTARIGARRADRNRATAKVVMGVRVARRVAAPAVPVTVRRDVRTAQLVAIRWIVP